MMLKLYTMLKEGFHFLISWGSTMFSFLSFVITPPLASFLWFVVGFIFLLTETVMPGLYFCLSFACGSFVCAVTTWYGFCFLHQIFIWFCATLISFILLRMFGKHASRSHYHSNYEALVGKTGMVTHAISLDVPGRVQIQGDSWVARSHENTTILVGQMVHVVALRGNTIIVAVMGPRHHK